MKKIIRIPESLKDWRNMSNMEFFEKLGKAPEEFHAHIEKILKTTRESYASIMLKIEQEDPSYAAAS